GQGGGDGGGGGLQQSGQGQADQHDQQVCGKTTARQIGEAEQAGQAAHTFLQGIQAEKQQAEARQRQTQFGPAPPGQQFQQCAQTDQRQRIKAELHLQSQARHQPAGGGVAQAGADHHTHCLGEGDQTGADESDQSDGGGGGGLHQRGDQRAGPEGAQ